MPSSMRESLSQSSGMGRVTMVTALPKYIGAWSSTIVVAEARRVGRPSEPQ